MGLLGLPADPVTELATLIGPGVEPLVVRGSEDDTLRVWTLAGDRWTNAVHDRQPGLLGRHDSVLSVAIRVGRGDRPLVICGGNDGSVRVWTLAGEPWKQAAHEGEPGLLGWNAEAIWSLATMVGRGDEPLVVWGSNGTVKASTLDGASVHTLGDVSPVRRVATSSACPGDVAIGFEDGSIACLRLVT